MRPEKEIFDRYGPVHLTVANWVNIDHCRTVAASLVQGVKIEALDRQKMRRGELALAPRWWESFHFQLIHVLVDDRDSVFGAIYELKPQAFHHSYSAHNAPRYVIAFRGTILRKKVFPKWEDLKLDVRTSLSSLHKSRRFELAKEAVQNTIDNARGSTKIWLVGYSLGAAIAMLVGKYMARTNCFIETYLFNPPCPSFFPIEKIIKNEGLKKVIHRGKNVFKAGLSVVVKGREPQDDPFEGLYGWSPYLFVNPNDFICSEYIGYFKNRNSRTGRYSTIGLLRNVIGKDSEPVHILPSAYLTINLSHTPKFKQAHGLRQWWTTDFHFQTMSYLELQERSSSDGA